MSISKKQDELDEIKWYMGQELGCDPCGTFAYCAKCKKDEENPCEEALKRYKESQRKSKKVKGKSQRNKQTINGQQFRSTVVDE